MNKKTQTIRTVLSMVLAFAMIITGLSVPKISKAELNYSSDSSTVTDKDNNLTITYSYDTEESNGKYYATNVCISGITGIVPTGYTFEIPKTVVGEKSNETFIIKSVGCASKPFLNQTKSYMADADYYSVDFSGSEVESIYDKAFENCTHIETVSLGTVKTIGTSAFYGCSSITTLDLTNVNEIGTSAFENCAGTKTIQVGNVENGIGADAFKGCSSARVTFTNPNTYIAGNSKINKIIGYSNSVAKDYATNTNSTFVTIANNKNLTKLVFDTNGGSISDAFTQNRVGVYFVYANKVNDPEVNCTMVAPTKEHYDFDGYYYGDELVIDKSMKYIPNKIEDTDSITLTAQYTPKKFNVSLDADGGSVSDVNEYTYGKGLTLPIPTRKGYEFDGWYLMESNSISENKTTSISTTDFGDKSFIARWKKITYTITYKLDNENKTDTYTIAETDTQKKALLTNADILKTGYSLMGFSTTKDGKVEYTSTIPVGVAENLTLYPVWSAKECQILLDLDGGSFGNTSCSMVAHYDDKYYDIGIIADSLDQKENCVPTKTGYVFDGWLLENGGFITKTTLIKDTTVKLKASWSIKNYNITYKTNGGSLDAATVGQSGISFVLEVPTRIGYQFNGWYADEKCTNRFPEENGKQYIISSTDITCYAKWTPNQFTITLNGNNGTFANGYETETTTAYYDETYAKVINNAEKPTRVGYIFNGWNYYNGQSVKGTDLVTGGTELKATWKENPKKITYDLNGGTFKNGYTAPETHLAGISQSLPTGDKVEKAGYSFTGWTLRGNIVTSVNDTENVTCVATWKANDYQITLDAGQGGSVNGKQTFIKTVTYDSAYGELPKAEQTGYKFVGWFVDGTQINEFSIVKTAKEHTLTAKWEEIKRNVTFMDGTEEMDLNRTYLVGCTYDLPANLEKKGFTFDGWYTDKSFAGSVVKQITSDMTGNLVFYAKWIPQTHIITLNPNGGNVDAEWLQGKEVTNGAKWNTLPQATRAGKSFIGWFREDGTKVNPEEEITLEDNIILTAQWSEETTPTFSNAPEELTKSVGNLKYHLKGISSSDISVIGLSATGKKKSTITIPDRVKINGKSYNVTKINQKALYKNKRLKKLTIGKNIKSIGTKAFYGCKKLTLVTIKGTKITSVEKNAFKGAKFKLKAPSSKKKSYKQKIKKAGGKVK